MLRGKDPAGGGSIRAVDVALCTRGIRGKREVGGWVWRRAGPEDFRTPLIHRQSSPGLDRV